jgi:versiconal hemiacetal acetate esterase
LRAYNNVAVLNGDRTRLFAIGQSAGGSLALTLVRRLISIGRKHEVKGIASVVPFVAHPEHILARYLNRYHSFDSLEGFPVTKKHAINIFFGE